jgi:hypothetical protein
MRARGLRPLWLGVVLAACAACGDDDPMSPDDGGGGGAPLAFEDFQAAAVVIGQTDMSSGDANAGGAVGPMGLDSPLGSPALGSLYVPDHLNHRVLGFGTVPSASGVAADFVMGQDDFASNASGLSASAFNLPVTCVVAEGRLFLLDLGNNRVLIWNSLPASSRPADLVVGQPDFTTKTGATTDAKLFAPHDLAVAGGRLFVADAFNHRVLIWNAIPTTSGQPADVVVGQPTFTANGSGLSATAFDEPVGVWAGATRLVVADYGNRRVLIYNSVPAANGAAADLVVGAPDFTTAGGSTPTATTTVGPYGVASDGQSLFVADKAAHRVLIYPFPTASGAPARGILGQTHFTLGAANDPDQDGTPGAVSARTFFGPTRVAVLGTRLVVTDQGNNRLLVFASR